MSLAEPEDLATAGLAARGPNPWLAIWVRPARTMRHLLATRPLAGTFPIVWLSMYEGFLGRAADSSRGETTSVAGILARMLVPSLIVAFLYLRVFGLAVRWTGRWLGGAASARAIRAALTWPHVLGASLLLLWPVRYLLLGEETFHAGPARAETDGLVFWSLVALEVVQLAVGTWWVRVQAGCLAEAQGFSFWRALANLALAAAPLVAAVFAVFWALRR